VDALGAAGLGGCEKIKNEELSTAAKIELSVDPRGVPMQDLQVELG